MKIFELNTPSFLVDLDLLQKNIREMSQICRENNKEIWPMTKTHKSSAIAKMQDEAGADGFLTGTIDEAQRLVDAGYTNLMLAYPIAGSENIQRIIELKKRANLIVSLDGEESAQALHVAIERENLDLEYLLIIDCGFHRFGVKPEEALRLVKKLQKYQRLKFKGLCTHPGHVYSSINSEEIYKVAKEEEQALRKAKTALMDHGFAVNIVATGSTPTAEILAKSNVITVLRPGNYVFYDNIQISMGVVSEERCALTVLATVISHPAEDVFIIDAGSKCFGLDKGAHGSALVNGFGYVRNHPDLKITGLSEEVAILNGRTTSIKVGDKIQIIPNHACSTANMTSYLIGYRCGIVKEIIEVDARGGSFRPSI